ncbi:Na/Pi cotransporter family protein [Lutimaribacter marinistellae]|uniref:Na/Pi cotransporter family protein n=1 Tax=Lutimaribacter marinistellae TaxID=1820329 RepID=A0ABV7TK04_9RHOB
MTSQILVALGGVGLFLVGMHMLSGGLRGLAGKRLRAWLARFTRTPLSGAVTGATATAVIQSSSATTVTAIGFVSAGLLTFPQALGIVFGANIGTTITGWLVAILGFKLNLGEVVLPLVLVGALLQLLNRGGWAQLGQALAGFSLLFIGIDAMKSGLEAFEGILTPQSFPEDTILGRLQLIGIGILITLVTQSSSAGVATALAALGAGAINFPQAAALVIGMDVGTTFTALLATVGGSTMTRRTGVAHVIYNLMTAAMAFLLLPFTSALFAASATDPQIGLVAFHSTFNFIGVVAVIPFTNQFARLIEWLVPSTGPRLTAQLDTAALAVPSIAIKVAADTVETVARSLADYLAGALGNSAATHSDTRWSGEDFDNAISETRAWLREIPAMNLPPEEREELEQIVHTLDHLRRLQYRCEQHERIRLVRETVELRPYGMDLSALCTTLADDGATHVTADALDRYRKELRQARRTVRKGFVEQAAQGRIGYEESADRMDALRWLHRSGYHLWRIAYHLHAIRPAWSAGNTPRPLDMPVAMQPDQS